MYIKKVDIGTKKSGHWCRKSGHGKGKYKFKHKV